MAKKKNNKPLTRTGCIFVLSGMLVTLERIENSQKSSLGKEFVRSTYGPMKCLLRYLKGSSHV